MTSMLSRSIARTVIRMWPFTGTISGGTGQTRTMADLHVHRDRLEIHLTTAEKVLALRKSNLVVPRDAIRSVAITEDPWIWIRGVRAPGASIPLTLAVGTWKFHGGTDFLLLKGKQRSAVVIDLEPGEGVASTAGEARPGLVGVARALAAAPTDAGMPFSRIIVSTQHAAGLVEALRIDPADPSAANVDTTF
jgi:hypothetical protein